MDFSGKTLRLYKQTLIHDIFVRGLPQLVSWFCFNKFGFDLNLLFLIEGTV